MSFSNKIAAQLSIPNPKVEAVLSLFEEGATIPFIARYRKDKTGGLNEVEIESIQAASIKLKEFEERKAFIQNAIETQGKMTDEISAKLEAATHLNTLEDIYLPFKPKRRTKAQIARENGLEPLALLILEQQNFDVDEKAKEFICDKVPAVEDAVKGAAHIIAEMISEDAGLRAQLRNLFEKQAFLESKLVSDKETEAAKFKDYFDFSEAVATIPSHRILAILRGFLEGYLRISIAPETENAIAIIEKMFLKSNNQSSKVVKSAIEDAYKRLLQPALETEIRSMLKQKADEDAIAVFAENLKQLLLSSPLGSRRILAVDPGYRTGCKLVCLDEKGELLHNDLMYIHEPGKLAEAERIIRRLIQQFQLQVIAIGDGTAGRETESFIKKLNTGLDIFLVNEDGASIYSASEIAREEFPNYDITVKGAVSIGRRLMDPLAELVKIDPRSIGVGQYQHDVNQVKLKEKLDQVVISCVNAVGVNLNTASRHLLSYVSGIGPSIASNIVNYRNEIGRYETRQQLKKVPRLGEKAFEQCAGFLRIPNGKNVLDGSAVHPEAYAIVESMARDLSLPVQSMVGNEEVLKKVKPEKYVSEEIGLLTIQDILKELKKPGLDVRSEAVAFSFADIYSIEDVSEGMIVPGIVTNITRFGAFVDIGVKQDGLVHVSEIANRYISDPAEALKLNEKVQVKVLEVDRQRKRIALSIKQAMVDNKKDPKPGKTKNISQHEAPANMDDALQLLKRKFGK